MGRFGNENVFSDYEVHSNQDWGMGRLMDSQEVFLNRSRTGVKQCPMLKGLNVLVVPCSTEESTLKVSSPCSSSELPLSCQ